MLKTLRNKNSAYDKHDVIHGLKKGQQWAQVAFYDMYFQPAYYTAYRIIRNRMDAEDAVHEGFIKAFGKINSLKNEASAEGWLKRIVMNETLSFIKANKVFTDFSDENEETEENTQTELDVLTIGELNECINQLPEGYRVISQLFFIEEMKHDEIGKALGITASTSRSQLTRAKRKLQEIILSKTSKQA